MQKSEQWTLAAIIVLLLICVGIWVAVHDTAHRSLRVSFLDVGQGDAIFVETPSGRQVLIDGGPGTEVLRKLPTVMPWYDRSLDLIIGTHADLDHIGGLIEIMPRFRVENALVPSTAGNTEAWRAYLNALQGERGAAILEARRGERIDLGDQVYIEVLFPDRALPHIETNSGCVITRVVYRDTSFMLPCDAPDEIEYYLALLDGFNLKSNVLKAGHHGSKTSSLPLFVGLVDPEYVVFSRGCDNTYGHPAAQTVVTFERFNIPMLDTCEEGTITFLSNGARVVRK